MPLFAQIGRLDPQKGWDLLAQVAETFSWSATFSSSFSVRAIRKYHALLENLARRYPGQVLGPSRLFRRSGASDRGRRRSFPDAQPFEPCGLNQLYSLAHGTVPIVRADRRADRYGG